MLKKTVLVLVLAAFVGGPVVAPAFAAGDKAAAAACEKIKDKAKKAECLKKAQLKKEK